MLEINRSEEFIDCIKKAIQGIHSEYICPVKGRFYNIYANPVFRNNEVAGAVVIITDVTEKEERENLRREFSANVSHELKTPLTSISGIAEIIKNGIVDEKDVKTFAGKIYDEARRLIHLVEDIIKLSQLDEGEQAVEKTPIDIYDLSRIEIHHLEPVAEERHIKINLQGEHMMISGIHSVLEEMVYNLIENAIKYNKEDGTIDVMIKKKKHRCEFCVKDSGIGIPADQLDRIFERFYRVDKSHSKEIGGTGLGLSIVKDIVDMMNGTIKLESKENVGTTFTVTIPLEIDYNAEKEQQKKVEKPDLSGKNVLLVEDNELNREIATEILKSLGLKVDCAADGMDAVEIMSSEAGNQYDLIFMDIQMPKMDGYTATREIRTLNDSKKANIPIIAMTANAFDEDRKKAIKAGMNGHIAKPIDVNVILQNLDRIFGQ